eukprot:2999991-Alexandrium_andersonii.AAC.1
MQPTQAKQRGGRGTRQNCLGGAEKLEDVALHQRCCPSASARCPALARCLPQVSTGSAGAARASRSRSRSVRVRTLFGGLNQLRLKG